MTKPKILITKAERAEFAQDRADKKFRDKMTKAIRKLADASAAFDTFHEDLDVRFRANQRKPWQYSDHFCAQPTHYRVPSARRGLLHHP